MTTLRQEDVLAALDRAYGRHPEWLQELTEIVEAVPPANPDGEVAALREALLNAADALGYAAAGIAEWGEYASEYFKEKHNLAGDIEAARAAAEIARPAPGTTLEDSKDEQR
jgi:hypothetical protein